MENLDVITIGEAMAMFVATETGDLAEVEHFMKRVAGAELNVATGLARLGLKVGWVSRVGNDSFGRFVLQSLAKEGIDSHAVAIDNRFATGFQMKSKVENGTDPIVEYFRPRFYVSTSKSIIKALINMHSFEIQLSPIG